MGIAVGKPYIFQCGGKELAKVLYYYGYIPDVSVKNFKIMCPFHKDNNPSLSVDFSKGKFFCFGCEAVGDAFHFVELLNPKKTQLQVMMLFQRILNSNKVHKLNFSDRMKVNKYDSVLYDIAWDYYYGLSQVDWQLDRKPEVIHCRKYMYNRGFTPETLNQCCARITYSDNYPIIFPMLDNGVFKGWVCRTTTKEVEQKRKYLYNRGFTRVDTLVGIYNNCKVLLVVEGYMDRLKFVQAGITNVVAILGWKMSKQQEYKIKAQNISCIISALDNDECGVKGTKYLRTIFKNVVRFQYPYNRKDPGEMSKKELWSCYKKTMERVHV